ncbi:MAG: VWA domain-containing protein [Steroidobacteraceae bacterium]
MSALHSSFHFLRPAWLLLLPPLVGLAIWLGRHRGRNSNWSQLVDSHLLAQLRLGEARGARSPWLLVGLAWTVAVLALASPTWQRQQTPVYRAPAAWVLVLDLSPSMAAADVSPDRVTRARYAIEDLLSAAHDARVALVVFAGEPYAVTPLTTDVATVRSLLDPLAPSLMPESGDQLAPALDEAGRLLTAGNGQHAQVIVLTDGFNDPAQAMLAAMRLHRSGANVNVVGIGTATGAPEPDGQGGFVHAAHGRIVLTRLNADVLRRVAAAGAGRFVTLTQLPDLIGALHADASRAVSSAQAAPQLQVARWRNDGIWLLPALLLLAALLARRGWV